jgi:hypothetical protein
LDCGGYFVGAAVLHTAQLLVVAGNAKMAFGHNAVAILWKLFRDEYVRDVMADFYVLAFVADSSLAGAWVV